MTERPAERTASRPAVGKDDAPTKPASGSKPDSGGKRPLTERIQAKLSQASDEHRANASADSKPVMASETPAKRSSTKSVKAPAAKPGSGRPPRRARLRLTRVDPWSVMKTAFLLSIALGVVTVVSVFMVWTVLGAAGVWESINTTVQNILGGEGAGDFDVTDYVGTGRVLGFTMLVAVIDVVLLTAIATLGAFLYNMAAALLGGIEVTLAEDN